MRILLYLSLLLLSASCTTIYYEEPQPAKTISLAMFPEEIRGQYLMDGDTFSIELNQYSFPVVYENSYSLIEVKISPKLEIKDGLLYDQNIPVKKGIEFEVRNDSVHYTKRIRGYKILRDSLVLKKAMNYYVLSELDKGETYWSVFLFSFENDSLKIFMPGRLQEIGDMGEEEDFDGSLEEFQKITDFEKIEDNVYLIRPSKGEFKKLIKKGFFTATLEMGRFEKIVIE